MSYIIAEQTYETWSTKYYVVIVKKRLIACNDTSAMNFIPEEHFLLFFDSVLFIF